MLISTTDTPPGREAILGVNIFRDLFAGITDILGGRSQGYQKARR